MRTKMRIVDGLLLKCSSATINLYSMLRINWVRVLSTSSSWGLRELAARLGMVQESICAWVRLDNNSSAVNVYMRKNGP